MGTWGHEVLQNDACCDYMWGIYRTMFRCSANALHDIAKNLMLNPESPGIMMTTIGF